MTCPRCSAENADDARDCGSCGIVFAKWRVPLAVSSGEVIVRPAALPPPAWAVRKPQEPAPAPLETLGITHAGWKAAAVGFVMACALSFFPLLSFVLHPFSTLVHEIGHTAVFWLFGYGAIPAFDFGEGGGVTMTDYERSSLIVGAWVFGLAVLAWWQRERRAILALLAGALVVYFLMYNTRGERLAIALGGHGGEIVFGALFLYRGLTGWGCKLEVERPLYAFIAFMMLFTSLRLGFVLLGNSIDKAWYLQGKRGIDNDLVMGALYLGWTVEGMARALIAVTLLAVPAAVIAASLRKQIGAVPLAEEEV